MYFRNLKVYKRSELSDCSSLNVGSHARALAHTTTIKHFSSAFPYNTWVNENMINERAALFSMSA